MSTIETNTQPTVHDQSDNREHDIEKAYQTAHRSAKLGRRLAKQAEKMARRGQESENAKEPFLEAISPKPGRNEYDDPYSTQLATNAELKQRGSNTRVEIEAGERDEYGFKNEFDTIKITSAESAEDRSAK